MTSNIIFSNNQSEFALLQCFLLAISYVGSLYFYQPYYPRDHEITIKHRMVGVAIISVLSPLFIYQFSVPSEELGYPLLRWLGMHSLSIFNIIIPLTLTMILFTGPMVLHFFQVGIVDIIRNIADMSFMKDIKWYRTYVVAPFTEEFIFRACMLPILVPNFGVTKSIFLAPLFFGVAHFHHKIEQVRLGHDIFPVIVSGVFQMAYTTVFGAYSAFLFIRTGSLIGPVICHSYCNLMGFPEFYAVFDTNYPKLISSAFVFGLFTFMLLLFPLTDQSLFNSIYWT